MPLTAFLKRPLTLFLPAWLAPVGHSHDMYPHVARHLARQWLDEWAIVGTECMAHAFELPDRLRKLQGLPHPPIHVVAWLVPGCGIFQHGLPRTCWLLHQSHCLHGTTPACRCWFASCIAAGCAGSHQTTVVSCQGRACTLSILTEALSDTTKAG